jgi:hypothetical protein
MKVARWCVLCTVMPVVLSVSAAVPGGVPQQSEVFVTASFVDKNNLFIENLGQDEVQVLENDQPRPIEYMAAQEVPTVYGILFDRSLVPASEETAPMGGALNISKASASRNLAYELIDKELGRQTLWVGAYGRDLQVVLDFTPDAFRAKEAIQRIPGNRGREESFLYSALFTSVMRMKDRNEKRRVIIAFVDTLDVETLDKSKPLKNLLSSSNVELFFVCFAARVGSIGGGPGQALTQAGLKSFTQCTAGEALFVGDFRDHLDELTRRFHNYLRTFYTFGIKSEAQSGKATKLTIRCARPGSRVRHHPNTPVILQ